MMLRFPRRVPLLFGNSLTTQTCHRVVYSRSPAYNNHARQRYMATIYYEPSGCNCANKASYDRGAINTAATQALQLASEGRTVGRDSYPHAYNDYEMFRFDHAQKPYIEFPIMPSGEPYDGNSSPGPDRIVLGSIATDFGSAIYCAVITHDGQRKNGFVECKDDTINQNGSGTFDISNGQGKGEDPALDRQLLDRLDFSSA